MLDAGRFASAVEYGEIALQRAEKELEPSDTALAYSQKAKTYPELMQKVMVHRIKELRLRGRPDHPFTWGAFVATREWKRMQK